MRSASEIFRQLICLGITNESLPEDEEAVTLWECLEVYRLLVLAEEYGRRRAASEAAAEPAAGGTDPETVPDGPEADLSAAAREILEGGEGKQASKKELKQTTMERLQAWKVAHGIDAWPMLIEMEPKLTPTVLRQMASGVKQPIEQWRRAACALDKVGAPPPA